MNTPSQPQVGAQASPSPEPLGAPEQAVENKPLTIADVERIAEEKATRIAQSMVDKAEHRISKKAQDQIAAIDTSRQALGLSDEQVTQAKQRVIFDDLTAKPTAEQASPAPQTQTTQAQTEPVHPAVAALWEIFADEGEEVVEADPEWKEHIEKVWNDPNGTLPALRKAAYKATEAKRQRKATNQQQAPARVISGGQSQTDSAPPNPSARDYLQRAHKT